MQRRQCIVLLVPPCLHIYDGWRRIESVLNQIWPVEESVLVYLEDLFSTGKKSLQNLLCINIDIPKLSSNISLFRSSVIFFIVVRYLPPFFLVFTRQLSACCIHPFRAVWPALKMYILPVIGCQCILQFVWLIDDLKRWILACWQQFCTAQSYLIMAGIASFNGILQRIFLQMYISNHDIVKNSVSMEDLYTNLGSVGVG